MLSNFFQSSEVIFCIKNSSWKVSYQNQACIRFCGERFGHTCRDGCRVYADKKMDEGFHYHSMKSLRGGIYDILFYLESSYLLTIISNGESRLLRALEHVKPAMLTRREKEIYRLRMMKQTYRQISESLHISFATIKTHINNIRRKIDRDSCQF